MSHNQFMKQKFKLGSYVLSFSIAVFPVFSGNQVYAGSDRDSQVCSFYRSGKLVQNFRCSLTYTKFPASPSDVAAVQNLDNNEAYMLNSLPIKPSNIIDGFRWLGGNCIGRDDAGVKICWK
jgi:hypothetical protein